MTVEATLRWPDEAFADAPFLVDDAGVLTHQIAVREVAALAATLTPGSRTLIVAEPSVRCALSIIACWSCGSLAVLIDGREPEAQRRAIAHDVSATTVVFKATRSESEPSHFDLPLRALAVALRTSGSTGAPKFAAHQLASLVANARASNTRTPFGVGDRWLLSLAPHHIGGLAILVRAMVGGGAVRFGRGAGSVADDLRADHAITHVSLVGTQLRRLLDDSTASARLVRMKAVLLGGGPAPASWRYEAVAIGVPLVATYGLTECASQVTTGVAAIGDEADDAGPPLDGVDLCVADDGEILVSGPTLFAGYLQRGGVNDPRDARGYLTTGDLGRIDERGHLHVFGRKDAMFISGGENIQAEEIENVLRDVPGISQACVVAVDDATWQKRPVAFVVGAFELRALEVALAARLPRFKWPDRVHTMPTDEAAKAKPNRARLAAIAANNELTSLWSRSR